MTSWGGWGVGELMVGGCHWASLGDPFGVLRSPAVSLERGEESRQVPRGRWTSLGVAWGSHGGTSEEEEKLEEGSVKPQLLLNIS